MRTEILAAVFDRISKQQLNLLLFLSDWYLGKSALTDLSGHVRKVTSDEKMIFVSHQRHKRRIRDYFDHFSVIFEILSKFLIVFVRLILGKVVWRIYSATTGNWHQIWIWFEGRFKEFRVRAIILVAVFYWISKQQINVLFVI